MRRGKGEPEASGEGCDHEVFATQVSEYLKRAAEERAQLAARLEDEREYRAAHPVPEPVPVIAESPAPPQTSEPEPFVYEPTFASAEPAPAVQERVYAAVDPFVPVALAAPESSESRYISEAIPEEMLASLDPEPVSEVREPVVTDERPEMISFLDSMLDPTSTPVTAPAVSGEVARDVSPIDTSGNFSRNDASGVDVSGYISHTDASGIDVSSIVEIDDLVVSESNTSADELLRFEEAAPRTPAEEPRAVQALAKEAPAVPAAARRDVLAEFIDFDELGIVDGPNIALGEFAGFGHGTADGDEHDAEASEASVRSARRSSSVLDAIELLDGPEISDSIDYRQEPADRHERRVTTASAAAARTTAALEDFFEEPESEPAGSHFDFDGDLFTPLPIATQQHWPRPQGPSVKAVAIAPAFDAPPDAGVEFAPLPTSPTGRKKKTPKPAQDEWGLFDPAQCGFAALLEKLNEVTDTEESEPVRR